MGRVNGRLLPPPTRWGRILQAFKKTETGKEMKFDEETRLDGLRKVTGKPTRAEMEKKEEPPKARGWFEWPWRRV
jgi:hypothetical protein